MAAGKTMTGARGVVSIVNPNSPDAKPKVVGIFSSVSWGLTYDVQPVFTLGHMGPQELVYTAQEPVSVQCSGFRAIGFGAHAGAAMPNVSELLTHEYIQITVTDRQNVDANAQPKMATLKNLRPVSYNTTLSARNLEEISITYIGLKVDDESTTLVERADAVVYPGT